MGTSSDPRDLVRGDVIAGRWLILDVLGHGGAGTAFRCRDQNVSGSPCLRAIKVLYATGDASTTSRFHREREILQRIDHPNVLPCYDHGLHGEHFPYLVLEFVAGGSLERLLRQRRRLPTATAAWVGYQVASGLRAAKVIHRDIKAENILIQPPEGADPNDPPLIVGDLVRGSVVKVADFGLAKAVAAVPSTSLTLTQEIFGTPLYMAPEQVRGSKHVDHRVDIYALGVVLYEMAVGAVPFDDESAYVVMSKHLQEAHAYPADVEVDPGMRAIIDRCLQKDPEQRYQDYRSLLNDLRPLLGLPATWRYFDDPGEAAQPQGVIARLFGWLRPSPSR